MQHKDHNPSGQCRERDGGFLQFPLCALRFEPHEEQLDAIINYATVLAGRGIARQLGAEGRNQQERALRDEGLPTGMKMAAPLHFEACIGARLLQLTIPWTPVVVKSYEVLDQFARDTHGACGKGPLVRMRCGFVFDARGGKISYREFSVLCAIYSVIGSKPNPVRITARTIAIRSRGFRSIDDWRLNGDHQKPLLSDRQIRHTAVGLHQRGFFAMATPGRRATYYSHRLTQRALEDALVRGEKRKWAKRLERAEGNRQLREKIAAIRSRAERQIKQGITTQSSLRVA